MSDVDEQVLTSEEHLKAVLYQFINLYNRWAEDRQVAASQGVALAELVKAFSAQVAHFKMYEAEVRKEIQNSIHAEAKNMATFIGRTLGDAAIKEVEPTVRKLKEAAYDAGDTLSRYQSVIDLMHWKMMGIAVFTSILISLLIVWLLMPKPTLPLTPQQLNTYSAGEMLESVWPKLSVKEKQWILDLAKGKKTMKSEIKV